MAFLGDPDSKMPFLAPDWRCPGGKWIKSMDHGSSWESAQFWREKVFANINAVALTRFDMHR